MNKYYVYVFLREDRYTPYYVGKGSGSRCYRKQGRTIPIPPDRNRVVKIKDNLTEKQSFDLERTLIRFWGRKTDGGVLHNLTEGGEGCSGRIMSEDNKQKLSQLRKVDNPMFDILIKDKMRQSKTGHKQSKETVIKRKKTIEDMGGYKHSDEIKKKISNSKKGKPNGTKGRVMTQEHRDKIRNAHLERFKKQDVHPLKGRKRSEETKEKIRQSKLRRRKSQGD